MSIESESSCNVTICIYVDSKHGNIYFVNKNFSVKRFFWIEQGTERR